MSGLQRVTGVFLLDTRGWVLLQERDEHAPISPNQWGIVGGHVDPGEEWMASRDRELLEETGLPIGLAGVLWLQDLVDEDEFVVVFAGWLAAGHDGVLGIEPNPSGDKNLAEVAWRTPEELLAGDFRPAALLKLLDLGNLPELLRPEA